MHSYIKIWLWEKFRIFLKGATALKGFALNFTFFLFYMTFRLCFAGLSVHQLILEKWAISIKKGG